MNRFREVWMVLPFCGQSCEVNEVRFTRRVLELVGLSFSRDFALRNSSGWQPTSAIDCVPGQYIILS